MRYGVYADEFGQAGMVEETPLAYACAQGFRSIVELLINSGADVNYLCSVCLHYSVYS